ncbi:MAG: ABC transporter ATP-binding protein [Thermoflexales bacterium]|nr:ABC transporter ATP-binding protein [Thermoflexales bacterium]
MRSRKARPGAAARKQDARQQQLLHPGSRLAQLRHVPRTLGLIWAAAPYWTAATIGLLVIQGVLPILTVYLTRSIVNSLAALIGSSGDRAALEPAVIAIGLMGLVLLTGEVLGSAANYVRTALADQVQDQLYELIHAQATALDLHFYESPVYYDQLQRASIDAIERPLGLLDSLGSLLQNLITLLAMAGVLLAFAWWLPLALLVGTLPALWVALRTTWRFQQWRVANTVNQRRLTYYHRALTSDQMAAEIRLFDLGEHFSRAFRQLCR